MVRYRNRDYSGMVDFLEVGDIPLKRSESPAANASTSSAALNRGLAVSPQVSNVRQRKRHTSWEGATLRKKSRHIREQGPI